MEKIGARIWIARIMITWGIFAGLTALVVGSNSFAVVRFLLGVAEAGFFPGIVLYFTYWFPAHHHARIVSGFLIGLPIAVAARRADLHGAAGPRRPVRPARLADGCTSPRAIPTVLIGIITLFVLTDRPEQAKFLTAAGKDLAHRQARSRAPRQGGRAQVQPVAGHVQSRRCCCSR